MIDLTPIINAIIALLAAVVTYKFIPWIKARTTNEQRAYLEAIVRTAVYAAEQVYNTNGMGTQKMEYVKAWLKNKGFDVNEVEIEAAVAQYINGIGMAELVIEDAVDDTPAE